MKRTCPESADVVVVGAGPAGLMAAMQAARQGRRTVLIEQMEEPGKKLLVTGGGRCNLTNALDGDGMMGRFGKKGRFMRPALASLSPEGLRGLLSEIGIETHCSDGFHYFPISESAAEVRDALARAARESGVVFVVGRKASELVLENGEIAGLALEAEGPEGEGITSPCVILATGGRSYSQFGATGVGYRLARKAGHALEEPLPALVPLLVREEWVGQCAGVTIKSARARIDLPGYPKAGSSGDLLFTHRGLSGPLILDLSGEVAFLLRSADAVPLRVTLTKETLPADEWLKKIDGWAQSDGAKLLHSVVGRCVPDSVAKAICGLVGCGADQRVAYLTRLQRQELATSLAGVTLTAIDTEGFGKAMVTRGGVSLKEVSPQSLESRIVKGLFFAGELLDLDGPCGGYNLQWAFSSGFLAGLSAAAGREKR